MLKSHEKFHSANGKRLILIADDQMINREILGEMLKSDYEILYAEDGAQTMEIIHQYQDMISLVLLDIMMPVMNGLDILRALREEGLTRIPVIVLTSEKGTEIECLNLGASDFIPKPYPEVGIVQARVLRTIELSEDREIIQYTERDELTGLYNKEFFYRYAEQFDQFHKDLEMDAIIVDINRFHMINERYGRPYGDDVLRRVGEKLREMLSDSGGIVCRQEADTFMVYCVHRDSYDDVIEEASVVLDGESGENRIRLKMGIYSKVDKSVDIEVRFDWAKIAADTVKDNLKQNIAFYDNKLHEQMMFAEELVDELPVAIAENQFQVYYQPKFDIRPDTPILSSAEALVRWIHPKFGTISPGVFIPLFESNGLIERLDTYVWEETARQIRDWKDRLGYSVPVSVNVSRNDMYDSDLPETFDRIVREHGIETRDLLIEITESSYGLDTDQMVEMADALRSLGFRIEMDDFGSGYSSLNMLMHLPLDALKLDMQFVRGLFQKDADTHMLKVVVEISDYLSVPLIAEGVETEEQLRTLRDLGCDIVQGYFFSKPVPAKDFEAFILQKKEADHSSADRSQAIPEEEPQDAPEKEPTGAGEQVLRETEEGTAEPGKGRGIHLKILSVLFAVLAFLSSAALLVTGVSIVRGYEEMKEASDRYLMAQFAATELEVASDYLTDRVRSFVVTGDIRYLNDYFEEIEITKRREEAVEDLERLLKNKNTEAYDKLRGALNLSNELVAVENRAIRLTVESGDYSAYTIPDTIWEAEFDEEFSSLSSEEKREAAKNIVFDTTYMGYKDKIRNNVGYCTEELIRTSSVELERTSEQLTVLVDIQMMLTSFFFLIVLVFIIIIAITVRKPLTKMVRLMQNQETVTPTGVEELRFVTRTYNTILLENRKVRERLSHEASHDALTGLFNRGAYDLLMESADSDHMALLLIDVDYFKSINDSYGHAVGDRVLKRVADLLRKSFRSVDILCRIGGDEFAVVMTRVNSSHRSLVLNKINRLNELLQHPTDDLPPCSLSVGVAFSDRENPQGDIFRDADTALYRVKNAGRKGCVIYD